MSANELDRLRAQVLEYAEALAAERRRSRDLQSRIQEISCILPNANQLRALRTLKPRPRPLGVWLRRIETVYPELAKGALATLAKESGR